MFHNKVESDAAKKNIKSTHVFRHFDRHLDDRHIQTNRFRQTLWKKHISNYIQGIERFQ